jgi:hypothetical protein
MVVPIVRLYNQMPEPKYVMAMGACASGGGPFKEGYNVVSGMDKYLPVDVYVPGCPPTPQALLYGLIALQKKIDGTSLANLDEIPWYGVGPSDPTPVPILGPDIIDPRQMDMIRRQAEWAALNGGQRLGVRELPAIEAVGEALEAGAAAGEGGKARPSTHGKKLTALSHEEREASKKAALERKAARAKMRAAKN